MVKPLAMSFASGSSLDRNANSIPDECEFTLDQAAYCYCDAGSPCGNTNPDGGCSNSTGVGSALTACFSSSVAADDLVLTATGLPTNNFGIVFMGATQALLPFGNGILCVDVGGLGVFRFPVHNTGAVGSVVEGPGLVAYSQANFGVFGTITPGQTWNFQGWYRDPGGPCGSTFNLSNGLAVTFGP